MRGAGGSCGRALVLVLVVVVARGGFAGVAVAGALDGGGSSSAGGLEQMRGNFFEEARREARLRHVIAVAAAVTRAREGEGIHGAGEADVAEAALLFHLVRIVERARVREEALFESGEDDDGKLQP